MQSIIKDTDRNAIGNLIADGMEELAQDINNGVPLDSVEIGFKIGDFEVTAKIKDISSENKND